MTPLPLGQGHGKRKHTHVRSRVSGENPVETMSGVFGDLSAVFESQYRAPNVDLKQASHFVFILTVALGKAENVGVMFHTLQVWVATTTNYD